MCYVRNQDPCYYDGIIPSEMFFQCPDDSDYIIWLSDYASWCCILWYLSSIWICHHIWIPKSDLLLSTEQIFGRPYYDGLILEQDIALNRRSDSASQQLRYFSP